MIGRKGILFVIEWLIVAEQATALMSGCSGDFCFISSEFESEWRLWDSAQQWCRANGTRLIEVTREGIQVAMSNFLNSINGASRYNGRTLYTNGKRNPGSWTWTTKKTASSLSISTSNDISYAYGYLQLTAYGFTITASRPTDTKSGYICENESQCTNTNGVILNFRCYRSYSNEALSWYDARSKCLANEGDLASFDFITQNQDLRVLNGSWLTSANSYWLGLRREWWTWQESQADVKYSNWLGGGHPRTLSNDPSDCLCLEPIQWKWLECRCGEAKPLICISEILSSITISTTTTTTTTATTSTSTTKPNPSSSTKTSSTSPTASSSPSDDRITDAVTTNNSQNPSDISIPTALQSSTTAAAALEQHNAPKDSLDRDIAIGIGVGVGGGVVVVILVVVIAVIIIRKRSKGSNPEKTKKTKKKPKQLQTPDIIALQTTNNPEESPYVTVIRLPDFDETNASDKPETVYANLEFLTKPSLADNTSPDVVSNTGSSRPSSPSRLAEADVEVGHIEYNDDQYTIATCATFL